MTVDTVAVGRHCPSVFILVVLVVEVEVVVVLAVVVVVLPDFLLFP